MDGAPLAIFDLDGTLVDSMPVQADLFAEIVAGVFPECSRADIDAVYFSTAGAPLKEQYRSVPGMPASVDLNTLEAQFYGQLLKLEFPAFDDAAPCLSRLRADGWKLAVSSGSAQESVDSKLANTGLDRLVDIAFGSSANTGFIKGAPHNRAIMDALGPHENSPTPAFVGDTLHDVDIAVAAGFLSILLLRPGARHFDPDAQTTVISSLDEVLGVLGVSPS